MRVMLPCRSLTDTSIFPLASRVIGWGSFQLPAMVRQGRELARQVLAGWDAVEGEVGRDREAVRVETAAVIVHAEQYVRQRFRARAGPRHGQRQGGTAFVEEPTAGASGFFGSGVSMGLPRSIQRTRVSLSSSLSG